MSAPVQESADARLLAIDDAAIRLIDLALDEDIGTGDWTTRWIVPARARTEARLVARADGVVSGLALAAAVFQRLNPKVEVEGSHTDGDPVSAGDVVAVVRGPARAILAGQRAGLEFVRRLSGVATLARRYVDALKGTGAEVLGGEHGTPGWRQLEASALRAGGARPHRLGLFDVLVVGPGHIALAGSIAEAVRRVREQNDRGLCLEVEVAHEAEVAQAAAASADVVLLTTSDPDLVRAAARLVTRSGARSRPRLAVAADVKPAGARALAEAGARAIMPAALPRGAAALNIVLACGR